ncbi:MAG: PhnD/SsuA/transferrin family substrate-binding protein [Bacteroidota bacterium]
MYSSIFKTGAIVFTIVVVCFFGYISCKSKEVKYEPTYVTDPATKKILLFGVPGQPYYEATSSLVKYLNQHLKNVQVQTVASFTLEEYVHKLDQGYFNFTIFNGIKALEEQKNGYSIVGKVGDDDSYRGVILVNKDSVIRDINDLKNKSIASPGQAALAGHMMPMLYLHKNGIDVNKDIRLVYCSSFESAIMNVYLGKSAAAFSWITNWKSFIKRRPEIAAKVDLKWETPPLINTAILFRNDMDKETADELKNLLFTLHESEEGKNILDKIGFTKFEPADSNTYQPVKRFMTEYNAAIH